MEFVKVDGARLVRIEALEELAKLSGTAARPSAAPTSATSFASLASLAPPNVDRKRIAALTSSVTSTVQSGVNQAMSKLQ